MLEKSSSSINFYAALHRSADANADMLKFTGRRPAMKRHHGSAVLEKIRNCVLTSSDSRHDAEDANKKTHMFMLAGRRPGMKPIHCSGMQENKRICVLVSYSALHRTE